MADFVTFQTYYKDILEAQGLKEWDDAFAVDNIPAQIRDNAYHLTYSIPNVIEQDQWNENEVATTIKIFKKAGRKTKQAFDNAMCEAISLRQLIINPETIANYIGVTILGISSVSIIPEPVNTNDNSVIITLEFITRIISDKE